MYDLELTPEEDKRARILEEKYGITREEILRESYAIENDEFEDLGIIKVMSGDEFRASLREPKVTLSFTIDKYQAQRIDDLCKSRHITRSQYLRNTVNRDLALTATR